ncbi:TIM44-like domain-containing protein [Desulfovibrio sp. OttesenSCG-928-G11]|nr:TIM44-like domain-containing protein [Desulfovibrio sp. OttesenSCG-928-G11]
MMRKRLCFAATCALLAQAAWAGPLVTPALALGQAALAVPALAGQTLPPPSLTAILSAPLPAHLAATLTRQPQMAVLSGGVSGLRGADEKGLDGALGDNALGGGLLGALFLGLPYQGLNGADLVVMGLIGLLIYRRLNGRPKKGDRRFTLHSREAPATRQPPPGAGDPAQGDRAGPAGRAGRDDPHAGAPGATYASGPGGRRDPRDNPWSRRLGAPLQSPPDSPWLKDRDTAQGRHSGPRGPLYEPGGAGHGGAAAVPGAPAAGAPAFGGRAADIVVPEDFDAADFLEGARALYVRLQQAWAARDMSGLQDFMTPDMLALLQKSAGRQPLPLGLNIMSVETDLVEVTRREDREEARVLFEALMAAGKEEPATVREQWLFVRGSASRGMWQLAGIKALS